MEQRKEGEFDLPEGKITPQRLGDKEKIIELSKRFHSPRGLDGYLSTRIRVACRSNAVLLPEKQDTSSTTARKQ